jgi:hypothetical protein
MRGEAKCDLDELIRLERRAVQAVWALGLSEAKPPSPSNVVDNIRLLGWRLPIGDYHRDNGRSVQSLVCRDYLERVESSAGGCLRPPAKR